MEGRSNEKVQVKCSEGYLRFLEQCWKKREFFDWIELDGRRKVWSKV